MELKLPKSIQEFIDDTPVSKIGNWLRLLVTFYIKPINFFRAYYNQNIGDQLKQCILYTILFIAVLYVFIGSEIKDGFRIIFSIFLTTIPLSLLLYITGLLVRIKHQTAILSISFVFISFQLWQIPSVIFTYLFVKNEDYNFLFLSNTVATYSIFLIFFIFWFVINLKGIKILCSWVLSIILVNLFFCLLGLFAVDHSDNNINPDPIIAEVQYYLSNVKTTRGQPYSRIFNFENSDEKFDRISLKSNDTIVYLGESSYLSYRKMVKSNVKIIDSILKKVKFNRSRDIFTSLQDYYSTLDVFFDLEPPFRPYKKYNTYAYVDSIKVEILLNEYVISNTITHSYKEYLSKNKKLNEDDNFAYKSEYLPSLLLLPYYYLGKKMFKGEIYHVTTYF